MTTHLDASVKRDRPWGSAPAASTTVQAARSAKPRRPIPPKLYRVSEVADYHGVSRQTIHNYTAMGLLREASMTPGGHRLYDESVFPLLDEIEDLKRRNLNMQAIRERLADDQ